MSDSWWGGGKFLTRRPGKQRVPELEGPPVPRDLAYRLALRYAVDYGVPYTRDDLIEQGEWTQANAEAARLEWP